MIINLHQNTPEWLDFRRNKIGASDCPIIMGVSPFLTPLALWEQKLGLRSSQEKTAAMIRGSDLESEALNLFNRQGGYKLAPKVLLSTTHSWMMASFDGIEVSDETIEIFNHPKVIYAVEIKCPGKKDHEKAMSGLIPDKYFPQLQHQMLVAGLSGMWYFSYNEESSNSIYIQADKKYQEKMLEKEIEFYRCMKEFIPPTMTDRDYVKRCDPQFMGLCEQYKEAKRQLKECQEREKFLRDALILESGECNSIAEGLKLTKSVRRGSINYAIIPELRELDLDMYRSDHVVSWRITTGENYD